MKTLNTQINPTGNKRGLVFILSGCASGLFISLALVAQAQCGWSPQRAEAQN